MIESRAAGSVEPGAGTTPARPSGRRTPAASGRRHAARPVPGPVHEQVGELVEPEQHRRHREHSAQQQERLVGRVGSDSRRYSGHLGGHDSSPHISAVAALDEPTRRRLYDFVVRRHAPVSRDEAAEAVGVPRTTVAFHLDRLVAEGLLEVVHERRSGRTGPGAALAWDTLPRPLDAVLAAV
ncbi:MULTISPECIES: helix-turn-helix domain-containing protein [Saccharothrix]|uniref:helix-turn-helix domain-containing protein n=1 Tax=Saccharothrix TaxID=2071 RepID=UPI0030839DD8